MSSTHIVRSLHEDMEAIGLDAIDPYIAGLPITEGKHKGSHKGQEAEREKYGMDDEELDDAEEGVEEVEPYADEVQEAAMEIFQIARPQIDESLIDYDEAEFNYDLLDSIAAMIESSMNEGTALEEAAQDAANTLSEAYNALTLTEGELSEDVLDERELRRTRKVKGPRGAEISKPGVNMRVTPTGLKVVRRTSKHFQQSRTSAMKRTGGVLARKRITGRIHRGKGKTKMRARRVDLRRASLRIKSDVNTHYAPGVMDMNESLANELRGLLHESSTKAASPAHPELAEALGRVAMVGALLGDFFESWGSDEDAELVQVMDEMIEMANSVGETINESDFDLEEAMGKVQTFSKVLAKALEAYSGYALVDNDGNVVEGYGHGKDDEMDEMGDDDVDDPDPMHKKHTKMEGKGKKGK